MQIDAHVHVTPDGNWFHTAYDASVKHLLRDMDAAEVQRAIVIGLPGVLDNTFLAEVAQRHPDRLSAVFGINPVVFADAPALTEELKTQFGSGRFVGCKLHPRLNGYALDDARVYRLFDAMRELGLRGPVWIDTLLYSQKIRMEAPPVLMIQQLVARFPEIDFILAHGCGPEILTLCGAIRSLPNAYVDLSLTLTGYAGSSVDLDIRYLLDHFEKRLIYGSDFPEVTVTQATARLAALAEGSKPNAFGDVVGTNAQQLIIDRH